MENPQDNTAIGEASSPANSNPGVESGAQASGSSSPAPTAFNIKGYVYWINNLDRVQAAVVRIAPDPDDLEHRNETCWTSTDANGSYEFKDVAQGTWVIDAFHDESRPDHLGELPEKLPLDPNPTKKEQRTAKKYILTISNNQPDLVVNLGLYRYVGQVDNLWGRWTLGVAIALLCLLCGWYYVRHLPDPNAKPLTMTSQPVQILITKVQSEIDAVKLGDNEQFDLSKYPDLAANLGLLKTTWATVSPDLDFLTTTAKNLAASDINQVSDQVTGGKFAAANQTLQQLSSAITVTQTPPDLFFWTDERGRIGEVLFWALAGVLVHIIIITGIYLRWENFYKQGIPMHISQFFGMPLLALVAVQILSMADAGLRGAGLQINLAEPHLLAAAAFLLGVQPWITWRFIRQSAQRLTGETKTETKVQVAGG